MGCDMASKQTVLFENGKTDFKIITNACESLAANEAVAFLQSIFVKVTGNEKLWLEEAKHGKILALNKEKVEALRRKGVEGDGYLTEVSQNAITISALTDKGLLYGAYGFSEKFFGVRFLHPEETVIPKCETLAIPVGEEIENPFFNITKQPGRDTKLKGVCLILEKVSDMILLHRYKLL